MNQDIIKMARSAGLTQFVGNTDQSTELERFFNMAQADMKEKCALICDDISDVHWRLYKKGDPDLSQRANPHTEGKSDGAADCAAAIRAIGDSP